MQGVQENPKCFLGSSIIVQAINFKPKLNRKRKKMQEVGQAA